MGRWPTGARERLLSAAVDLFAEHGYEHTTVADIAERAGVTERTFFRHFPDKRESLFANEDVFNDAFANAIRQGPAGASVMDLIRIGLVAAGEELQSHRDRDDVRAREAVIRANGPLQERDLLKRARLTEVVTTTIADRGIRPPEATLAAELTTAVFFAAYARWLEGDHDDLIEAQLTCLTELRAIAAH